MVKVVSTLRSQEKILCLLLQLVQQLGLLLLLVQQLRRQQLGLLLLLLVGS
jgi:hypothetical protein